MVPSPEQQLFTLMWMVGAGVGVGFIFDLYRIARGLMQPRWLLTALGDLFFWLLVIGFTYGILLQVNFGEVRSFIFLGIVFGLFLYYRLLSALVIRLALFIIAGVSRGAVFLARLFDTVFLKPGYHLICILVSPLRRLGNWLQRIVGKGRYHALGAAGHLGQGLRRRMRLIYRLLKHKLLFLLGKK